MRIKNITIATTLAATAITSIPTAILANEKCSMNVRTFDTRSYQFIEMETMIYEDVSGIPALPWSMFIDGANRKRIAVYTDENQNRYSVEFDEAGNSL